MILGMLFANQYERPEIWVWEFKSTSWDTSWNFKKISKKESTDICKWSSNTNGERCSVHKTHFVRMMRFDKISASPIVKKKHIFCSRVWLVMNQIDILFLYFPSYLDTPMLFTCELCLRWVAMPRQADEPGGTSVGFRAWRGGLCGVIGFGALLVNQQIWVIIYNIYTFCCV